MKIDIRILTCDRTRKNVNGVNYIHTTILNLLSSGGANGNPVTLYVSHLDTKYIDMYRNQFNIYAADQELDGFQNFMRACSEPSSSELLLILEDDLDFSSNFIDKLTLWLGKYNHYLMSNLVTLYASYIEVKRCLDEGREVWRYGGIRSMISTERKRLLGFLS